MTIISSCHAKICKFTFNYRADNSLSFTINMNIKDQTVQHWQLKETQQKPNNDQIIHKKYNSHQTRQKTEVKEFNVLTAK